MDEGKLAQVEEKIEKHNPKLFSVRKSHSDK
jgi:hypothetical protein